MYDRLQQLGTPHKEGLDQADRQQVYNCIKDRTGMFLSQDKNVRYVEMEEELETPEFKFTGEAKEALNTITTRHTSYLQRRQALLKPPRNLKARSKVKLFS